MEESWRDTDPNVERGNLIRENKKLQEELEKKCNMPCPVCGELLCEDSQQNAEAEWQRMEAENIRLKETLKKIDNFRKLSSVDMADPLEQQLYDWQVACKRCWDVAQQALEPNKPKGNI